MGMGKTEYLEYHGISAIDGIEEERLVVSESNIKFLQKIHNKIKYFDIEDKRILVIIGTNCKRVESSIGVLTDRCIEAWEYVKMVLKENKSLKKEIDEIRKENHELKRELDLYKCYRAQHLVQIGELQEKIDLIERGKKKKKSDPKPFISPGRPVKESANIEKIMELKDKGYSIIQIANELGVSRYTVYNRLAQKRT